MQVIKGDIKKINHIDGLENSVVVVGTFDGVHTWHQKVLREAEKISGKDNLQFVLVTFDKSFKSYFTNEDDKILQDSEKMEFIDNYFAVDYYVELETNKNLAKCSKIEFLNWMRDVLKATKIVEGSDFTFGTNKEGTVEDLKQFFGDENTTIIKRRNTISSSKIRDYIETGKIEKANKLLFQDFKIYLKDTQDPVKFIEFPNIPIERGYYDVLINGEVSAEIVIADNRAVSVTKITDEVPDKIKTMTLLKYLGKTIN